MSIRTQKTSFMMVDVESCVTIAGAFGGKKMDPNETLKRLREIVSEFREDSDGEMDLDAMSDMVDHFEALDEWIAKGGFLPKAWNQWRLPPG